MSAERACAGAAANGRRRGVDCGDCSDAMAWGSMFMPGGDAVHALWGSLSMLSDSVMDVARTIKPIHGGVTHVRPAN